MILVPRDLSFCDLILQDLKILTRCFIFLLLNEINIPYTFCLQRDYIKPWMLTNRCLLYIFTFYFQYG